MTKMPLTGVRDEQALSEAKERMDDYLSRINRYLNEQDSNPLRDYDQYLDAVEMSNAVEEIIVHINRITRMIKRSGG